MSSKSTEVWGGRRTGTEKTSDRESGSGGGRGGGLDPDDWDRWTVAGIVLAVISAGIVLFGTSAVSQLAANAGAVVALGAGYGLLITTSGWVVRGALWFAGVEPDQQQADTGRAVGKIENVLVLTLAVVGAYTALAVVFAAKSIVRWQDISSGNTTYYLTGSIANVTYSLVYGVALAQLLQGSLS